MLILVMIVLICLLSLQAGRKYRACKEDYTRLHLANDSINALLTDAKAKIIEQDSAVRRVFAQIDTTGRFPAKPEALYLAYRYQLALIETDSMESDYFYPDPF